MPLPLLVLSERRVEGLILFDRVEPRGAGFCPLPPQAPDRKSHLIKAGDRRLESVGLDALGLVGPDHAGEDGDRVGRAAKRRSPVAITGIAHRIADDVGREARGKIPADQRGATVNIHGTADRALIDGLSVPDLSLRRLHVAHDRLRECGGGRLQILLHLHVGDVEGVCHLVEAMLAAVLGQQLLHGERWQGEEVAERVFVFDPAHAADRRAARAGGGL